MTILATPSLYIVWALMIAGEAALVVVLLAKRRHERFPVFTAYACLLLVKSLTLVYVSRHDEHGAYFYAYYLLNIPESLFGLAVIAEVFGKVFAPKTLLTRGILNKTVLAYIIVVLTFVLLSLTNIQEHPIAVMRFARFIERAAIFALFGSFVFLCCLSKYLQVPWRKHCFGIGAGFVVMLSVSAVYHALIAWASVGSYEQLRYISMLASILGLTIWTTYFWHNEPELVPVSEQTLQEIKVLLAAIGRSVGGEGLS